MKTHKSKPAASKQPVRKPSVRSPVQAPAPRHGSTSSKGKPNPSPAVQEHPQVDHPKRKSQTGLRAQEAAGSAEHPASPAQSVRSALIKLRHELMKREIDQIREDLEAEDKED